MGRYYYRILFEGLVVAEKMSLETALILLRALFSTFLDEESCNYEIEKTWRRDGGEEK